MSDPPLDMTLWLRGGLKGGGDCRSFPLSVEAVRCCATSCPRNKKVGLLSGERKQFIRARVPVSSTSQLCTSSEQIRA
jgi:hypothetical protein